MKPCKLYIALSLLILLLLQVVNVQASTEPYAAAPLKGNQLRKDSASTVRDTVFFNTLLKPTQTTFSLRNIVTFKINEFANRLLPDHFTDTIRFKVYYRKPSGDSSVKDSSDLVTLILGYHKSAVDTSKAIFVLNNAVEATVKIFSHTASVPLANIENSLMLENELYVTREYQFNCTSNKVASVSQPVFIDSTGELDILWSIQRAADEYDLEWTYIDSLALANYKTVGSAYDMEKIFRSNGSRVTVAQTHYRVPMLYDGGGILFYRVRAVQVKGNNQRIESDWTSSSNNYYPFAGHENSLNWQVSTSFAEEGKRKSVIQYFDGSLRNRQTVTKDNTTNNTVVAETLYDYQGRPAIQVMPAPTLSSLIKYTPKFNPTINSGEYIKDLYDGELADSCYCKQGATGMDTSSGASKYYSPANPLANTGFHKYIPDAKGFPFSETRYTPDNTGRVYLQSGVGPEFRIDSGRATQYSYTGATQEELDALFGTEVGNASHYFKNTVRDANGQYSISYVDMHGRTIATALTGSAGVKLDTLPSNKTVTIVKVLSDSTSNVVKGTLIESVKGLQVTKADSLRFKYSLLPDSVSFKTCTDTVICYDCRYDLEIIITDECNNSTLPGGVPYVIKASKLSIDTTCNADTALPAIDKKVFLREGNYIVTKRLTISPKAMNAYQEIFLRRNTCKNLEQFIEEQKELLRSTVCEPTCASCVATLGTWETFRPNYMVRMGIDNQDTAAWRSKAQKAYDLQVKECEELCLGKSMDRVYEDQMLADVTAPDGQYANPDSIDAYSVFQGNQSTGYRYSTVQYTNEDGVLEANDPGKLTIQEFAENFKPSWANALLKLHPEYPKLQLFRKWKASHEWDLRFENTETYQAAVDSGYLNPAGFSGLPADARYAFNSQRADPFFTTIIPTAKSNMQARLFNCIVPDTGIAINAWSMATIMAHCPENDTSCLQAYKRIGTAFTMGASCSGELDLAWKYFRGIYLQKKREFQDEILTINVAMYPSNKPYEYYLALRKSGHSINFVSTFIDDNASLPSTQIAAKDSVNIWIDSNCRAYAKQWWDELKPCGFSQADSANIIGRLIQVCKEGGDAEHFYGASTVKPSSTNLDRSFEQVIKDYAGSNYNSTCNVYLLSAPLPYENQPIYYEKPVIQKPDDCECATISKLYNQYRSLAKDASFSDYIYRTTNKAISNGKLDTLRMACDGQLNCSKFKDIIYLPAFLQCRGEQRACATCAMVDTLYKHFKQEFPGITPVYDGSDSVQNAKNDLFEKYMNRHLGFGKMTADYLDFMRQCAIIPVGDTSLIRLKKDFLNDTDNHGVQYDANGCDITTWRIFYPGAGAGNNTGYTHSQIFNNGILKFPDSLNRGGRPNTLDYDFLGKDSACVERHFSLELKIKYPMKKPDQTHVLNLEWYFSYNPVQKYYWYTNLKNNYGSISYIDYGTAETNRGYANVTEFKQDYSDWRVVKFECIDSVLKFYVDGQLLRTFNFPAGIPLEKLKGFAFQSITDGDLPISLDYIRAYDKNGRMFYNEEFNDCSNFSHFEPYIRCPQPACADAFVSYFNKKRLTTYTKTQIDSLYAANQVPLDVCNAGLTAYTLCGNAEAVSPLVPFKQRTTCDDSTLFAVSKGTLLYEAYRDSLINSFNERYLEKCRNARYRENFTVEQKVNEFHYTLYYYDQAGNLVKTIPPAGVDVSKFAWAKEYSDSVKIARRNKQVLKPNHNLLTDYRYNTLNQVVSQQSPDGGNTNFWYDRLGRLVVSQNAKQKAASNTEADRQYSYTQYDNLGRITEVGQVANTVSNGTMTNAVSRNQNLFDTWMWNLVNKREQITTTVYDLPYSLYVGSPTPQTAIGQRNVRNRVSYTSYTEGTSPANYNQATFYTYDILGNVDTLLQDYGRGDNTASTYNMMNRNGNRTKKFVYQYDLISGKVNMVMYQRGWTDQLLHRYSYDAENRLTLVETSNDSITWEKDARYEYYRHGPLARTIIGEQLVQGVDYAYTLQGWLKGVNSTGATSNYDIGGDGNSSSANQFVARDAIGFNLNYFSGDFKPIGTNAAAFPSYRVTNGLPDNLYRPLYNGNISSMATFIRKFESNGAALLHNYQYDQLNRLTGQRVVRGFNRVANDYEGIQSNLTDSLDFYERIAYDANGNILRYRRYDEQGSEMDSLTYKYYANSNKLKQVRDNISATKYGSNSWDIIFDIDDQADNNYVYDAIGNLIEDKSEGNTQIKWNVYGKITEITKTALANKPYTHIVYTYDAQGNRISKVSDNGTATKDYTWYVRDAQGNLMSTYGARTTVALNDLQELYVNLKEQYVYGSSKLGVNFLGGGVDGGPQDAQYFRQFKYVRGFRQYELSNHLGNVLSTISDKKIGVSSGAVGSLIDYYEPDIVSANDYYPFGMVSRVSLAANGQNYRFGFNGQEMDHEIKGYGNATTAMFWEYDSRIGRRWNLDPRPNLSLSGYSTFLNNPLLLTDKRGDTTLVFSAKDGSYIDLIPDGLPNQAHFVTSKFYKPFPIPGMYDTPDKLGGYVRSSSVAFIGEITMAKAKEIEAGANKGTHEVFVLGTVSSTREITLRVLNFPADAYKDDATILDIPKLLGLATTEQERLNAALFGHTHQLSLEEQGGPDPKVPTPPGRSRVNWGQNNGSGDYAPILERPVTFVIKNINDENEYLHQIRPYQSPAIIITHYGITIYGTGTEYYPSGKGGGSQYGAVEGLVQPQPQSFIPYRSILKK